jgi:16S rRNA (cytosine1402-N4)-methyltransferase
VTQAGAGFAHVPVLARETLDALRVQPDGVYLDATTGGGGHSALIAARLTAGRLICMDKDADALAAARENLRDFADKITFVKADFRNLAAALDDLGVPALDGALFDLGVSSWQLDSAARGFSYMKDAPLDMRMDRDEPLTAYAVVNTYSRLALSDIFTRYGEERYAQRIAAAIEAARSEKPIETTGALAEIIARAMPGAARREKQHPAKRCFQAIRLEVNGELDAAQTGVAAAIDRLAPGGRVAVISFHSLEDRIVKGIFADAARGCVCPPEFPVCVCGRKPIVKLTPKGVIIAGPEELAKNPRARSAKLRCAEKL